MSCLCSGTGSYRVSRFSVLLNEYRIVEKTCACRGESVDFPYEDVMRGAKMAGTIKGAPGAALTAHPALRQSQELTLL